MASNQKNKYYTSSYTVQTIVIDDTSKLIPQIRVVLEYLGLSKNTVCTSTQKYSYNAGLKHKEGLQAFMCLVNTKNGNTKISYGMDESIDHDTTNSVVDFVSKQSSNLEHGIVYISGYISNTLNELVSASITHTGSTRILEVEKK